MVYSVTGVIDQLAVLAPASTKSLETTRRMTRLKAAASDMLERLLETEQPLVLVVDDDAEYRGVLMQYLQASDLCRAVAVPSAAQALAMLSRERVSLVVTDYHMPVMDGVSLLRVVKKRWPGVVRVLMSGSHASSVPRGDLMRQFVRKQTSLMEMTDILLGLIPE